MVKIRKAGETVRRFGERLGFWSMVVGALCFGVGMVMCSIVLFNQNMSRIYTSFEKRVQAVEIKTDSIVNGDIEIDYGESNEEFR